MDKTLGSRKALSASGLLATVRNKFEKIQDHRGNANRSFQLEDALMSGVAVFGIKCPSLLQFDHLSHHDDYVKHNLGTLYGVAQAPCDTRMREIIDPVEPSALRAPFKAIFADLQRGKALEAYQFMNGAVLVSLDGTGYFSSHDVHCDNCCEKKSKDGTITYYHQMLAGAVVHPDIRTVIPLVPEPIIKQDGANKNDCERNAAKRMLHDLRREHPHLKMIIIEDSLSSNAPHINLLRELKFSFILGVKPGDHKALFELVEDATSFGAVSRCEMVDGKTTHRFRFINDVPLNDGHQDVRINFLECWEIKNGKTQHFSWVTDIALKNDNVLKISQGGRARWKIENETFNTLKNQGYNFEHNFGHGHKNLSTNFAILMMLAFLIDQVQELCCKLFQAAKDARVNRKSFWEKMRAMFTVAPIDSWETLYRAIAFGYKHPGLIILTNSS